MDKKTLIEEGWLSQYLLGELNADDNASIEHILEEDKELRAYYKNLELTFETMSLENSIEVPSHVKTALLDKVKGASKNNIPQFSNKKYNFKMGVAASIAALFMLGCFYLYSELGAIKNDIKIVKEENSILKENLNETSSALTTTNSWFDMITDENTDKYVLTGNALSPETKVVSYINHQSKAVALHAINLPSLDEDHDYQMWADVDGEMINMGLIPKNKDLIAMAYVENTESLNITIETAGGNNHPTVERLITNIYLR